MVLASRSSSRRSTSAAITALSTASNSSRFCACTSSALGPGHLHARGACPPLSLSDRSRNALAPASVPPGRAPRRTRRTRGAEPSSHVSSSSSARFIKASGAGSSHRPMSSFPFEMASGPGRRRSSRRGARRLLLQRGHRLGQAAHGLELLGDAGAGQLQALQAVVAPRRRSFLARRRSAGRAVAACRTRTSAFCWARRRSRGG